MICPKCHVYFANMDIKDYPNIHARHIKILVGDKKKPKDGQSLFCSQCGYELTTYDVVLIAADTDKNESLQPGQKVKI